MSTALPTGPKNARIAIVGMGPARDEIASGHYFSGPSGQILDRALNANGLTRKDVYVTNVHDGFLAPGTSLFSLPSNVLHNSISRLRRELQAVRPNVVMPLGDEPLQVICGLSGITKWRGSILEAKSDFIPGLKCVPSIHTAWILRGMWKWFGVFAHIDLPRVIEESKTREIKLPIRNAVTGPGKSTTLDYLADCEKSETIAFDIEGTGEITCCGFAYSPNHAICIPFTHQDLSPYWSLPDEAIIWRAVARVLQSNVKKIGHRIEYDWLHFWKHKVYPANMYIDLHKLHHTLYPDFGESEDIYGRRKPKWDEPGHSLALITSQYTRTPYYKDDGRKWSPKLGEHQFWRYNTFDCMIPMEAGPKMAEEAREANLWDIYINYKQRQFPHMLRMEWFGVSIDLDMRAQASVELAAQAAETQNNINKKLGYNLNVNSPKQVMDLLYNRMKLKPKINKQTGKKTADKYALMDFADQTQDEVLLWIRELRSTLDLKGDIVDQQLGPENHMHTHYGYTDTHRWTSSASILGSGTNLQNIPVRGIARKLFIP